MASDRIPGHEGSQGPFPDEYTIPHVYARDIHSGSGNCVCGAHLTAPIHTEVAPGVPMWCWTDNNELRNENDQLRRALNLGLKVRGGEDRG